MATMSPYDSLCIEVNHDDTQSLQFYNYQSPLTIEPKAYVVQTVEFLL